MNYNSELGFENEAINIAEKISKKYNNIIGKKNNSSIEKIVESIIDYYENIISCMPGNVYWLDKSGIALGCNKNVLKMFGLNSLKDFKGLTFEEMGRIGHWLPTATQSFKLDTLEVIKTGKAKLNVVEPPIPHHNGEILYFLTSRVPLFDENGAVIGVVGISIDISKQKETEKKLTEAKEKAEAANKAKTEFLANMRHDIRTPLGGIIGLSELIKNENSLNKTQKYITQLSETSKELLRYFNEILEAINVASGEIPILKKKFSLKKTIENAIKLLQTKANEKNLELTHHIDTKIPEYLIGDSMRLYRILLELVGNALKFTHEGHIRIAASLAKKEGLDIVMKLEVSDTGPGIPKDKQAELFVNFKRLNPSYQGIYKGAGLGLSIIKQFVEDLQGEIYVESIPQQGSKFICLLPVRESLMGDAFGEETYYDPQT